MDSNRNGSMRSEGPSSEEIPLMSMISVLDKQKRAQDLSLLSLKSTTSHNFDAAPVDVTVGMATMFKSAPYQQTSLKAICVSFYAQYSLDIMVPNFLLYETLLQDAENGDNPDKLHLACWSGNEAEVKKMLIDEKAKIGNKLHS